MIIGEHTNLGSSQLLWREYSNAVKITAISRPKAGIYDTDMTKHKVETVRDENWFIERQVHFPLLSQCLLSLDGVLAHVMEIDIP
jgi:hypothetical protein